eukprot:3703684-Prymnesium_polylepis.1
MLFASRMERNPGGKGGFRPRPASIVSSRNGGGGGQLADQFLTRRRRRPLWRAVLPSESLLGIPAAGIGVGTTTVARRVAHVVAVMSEAAALVRREVNQSVTVIAGRG